MSKPVTIEVQRSPERTYHSSSDSLERLSPITTTSKIKEKDQLDSSSSKPKSNSQFETKDVPKSNNSKCSNLSTMSSDASSNGKRGIANLEKSTSGPPSFRLPRVGNDTIDVLVGRKAQKFVVHKSFLCHHSPFFEKCLNSQLSEAQSGIVKLEKTNPDAFGLFVDWIYTGMIKVCSETTALRYTSEAPKTVIDLWILADHLQIPRLQNCSIDLLISIEDYDMFFVSAYLESWKKAETHAQLHKFIVKKLTNTPHLGSQIYLGKPTPRSLMRELFDVLTDRDRKTGLAGLIASEYYV